MVPSGDVSHLDSLVSVNTMTNITGQLEGRSQGDSIDDTSGILMDGLFQQKNGTLFLNHTQMLKCEHLHRSLLLFWKININFWLC